MSNSKRTRSKKRSLSLSFSLEEIVSNSKTTPSYIADHIRRVLKDGGSTPHSEDVQHFFKEVITSRGWYTAELRKVAVRFRRSIERERGLDFAVQVADELFSGPGARRKSDGCSPA